MKTRVLYIYLLTIIFFCLLGCDTNFLKSTSNKRTRKTVENIKINKICFDSSSEEFGIYKKFHKLNVKKKVFLDSYSKNFDEDLIKAYKNSTLHNRPKSDLNNVFSISKKLMNDTYSTILKSLNVTEFLSIRDYFLDITDNMEEIDPVHYNKLGEIFIKIDHSFRNAIRFGQAFCKIEKLKKLQVKDVRKRKKFNLDEWIFASSQDEDSFFMHALKVLGKTDFMYFFEINKNENLETECALNEKGELILTIPFYLTEKSQKNRVKELIQNIWSNKKIKIKLEYQVEYKENYLKIEFKNRFNSYVSKNQPLTIVMGTKDDIFSRNKILVHEFGHILGFNDCYLEFYDVDTNELIYYELNTKNLMCSLSSKNGLHVPSKYLSLIADRYCGIEL